MYVLRLMALLLLQTGTIQALAATQQAIVRRVLCRLLFRIAALKPGAGSTVAQLPAPQASSGHRVTGVATALASNRLGCPTANPKRALLRSDPF